MLDRLKVLNDNTDGRDGQPESDSVQHNACVMVVLNLVLN